VLRRCITVLKLRKYLRSSEDEDVGYQLDFRVKSRVKSGVRYVEGVLMSRKVEAEVESETSFCEKYIW